MLKTGIALGLSVSAFLGGALVRAEDCTQFRDNFKFADCMVRSAPAGISGRKIVKFAPGFPPLVRIALQENWLDRVKPKLVIGVLGLGVFREPNSSYQSEVLIRSEDPKEPKKVFTLLCTDTAAEVAQKLRHAFDGKEMIYVGQVLLAIPGGEKERFLYIDPNADGIEIRRSEDSTYYGRTYVKVGELPDMGTKGLMTDKFFNHIKQAYGGKYPNIFIE